MVYRYKIVFIGDSGVGKTSLVYRILKDDFNPYVSTTIGAAFCTKTIEVERGESVELQIWDTAGQERYKSIIPMYLRNVAAAILCFAINDTSSQKAIIDQWYPYCTKEDGPKYIYLVGTKSDYATNMNDVNFINKIQSLYPDAKIHMTSAKHGDGVSDLFRTIASDLYKSDLEPIAVPKPLNSIPEGRYCYC